MSSKFLVSQLQPAVLDANVLYPAPMRDLLMTLAARALYLPRWTQVIHDEWMRNVLQNLPHVTPERLERTKSLMLEHVPKAMVTDFEHLIEVLELPDSNDRHVLAAAIQAKAKLIVTNNIKDFPKPILEPYQIQAIAPDAFIMSIVDSKPDQVLASLRYQRSRLKNPIVNQQDFLTTLEHCGLRNLVAWVRNQEEPI
jgi:predicted nucleic acid-binding protein